MKDLLEYTKERSAELAEYLEWVSAAPLMFEGDEPLRHSSYNHIHLWQLENLSDSYSWINTEYRAEFVEYVLEQWRRRLKGLKPYRERGYRMYVYEDFAPTVSVVAETDVGFPYSFGTPRFVGSIYEVVKLYEGRKWSRIFEGGARELRPDSILNIVEKHEGSIGSPTAQDLGIQVGTLRKIIANMDLGREVNAIRKRSKRRPADFSRVPGEFWHVYERLLPAGYE
jgi:hypothetical protein